MLHRGFSSPVVLEAPWGSVSQTKAQHKSFLCACTVLFMVLCPTVHQVPQACTPDHGGCPAGGEGGAPSPSK